MKVRFGAVGELCTANYPMRPSPRIDDKSLTKDKASVMYVWVLQQLMKI